MLSFAKKQEGIHELWMKLCGSMEEEVMEKYNVEEAKEDAHKGRGEPLKWQTVKREKKGINPESGEKTVRACIFSCFKEYSLRRKIGEQAGEEMKKKK